MRLSLYLIEIPAVNEQPAGAALVVSTPNETGRGMGNVTLAIPGHPVLYCACSLRSGVPLGKQPRKSL